MSAMPNASEPTPGQLANNGLTITYFRQTVRSGEAGLTSSPGLLLEILEKEAWRHWVDRGGEYRWGPHEFRQFLEAEPPRGCGVGVDVVRALLKPDSHAAVLFEQAIRAEHGGSNNPFGRAGKPAPGINHNNIMVDLPDVIPISPRRYSKEGTSVSYAVRRLEKQRPDLLERVKAGELSPHRAMVQAGFRSHSITIDDDPQRAAKRLLKHFQGDRLEALIWALSEGLKGQC